MDLAFPSSRQSKIAFCSSVRPFRCSLASAVTPTERGFVKFHLSLASSFSYAFSVVALARDYRDCLSLISRELSAALFH